MTAIGVVLIVLALAAGIKIEPSRYVWDWRDLFTTVPMIAGLALVAAGFIVWLWRAMP